VSEPVEPIGPPMACDVCGARLNNHEVWRGDKLEKMWWEHTALVPEGTEPHEPVPVLLDPNENPRAGFCDFCNRADPIWSFPASPFKMEIDRTIGWGSADNWAACQDCRDDIIGNDWNSIEKRYFSHKAVPKQFRTTLKQEVRKLHREFRLHRIGPPYKVR